MTLASMETAQLLIALGTIVVDAAIICWWFGKMLTARCSLKAARGLLFGLMAAVMAVTNFTSLSAQPAFA